MEELKTLVEDLDRVPRLWGGALQADDHLKLPGLQVLGGEVVQR